MTLGWVKEVLGCFSHFRLVFAVALIIVSLCNSSFVVRLIPPELILRIVAQQK